MDVSEPLAQPPWHFRLGFFLSRRGLRGGDRLVSLAASLGLYEGKVVRMPVGGGLALDIPLFREDNRWVLDLLPNYEAPFVSAMAAAAASFARPVVLIDCGADIGTVSVLLAAHFGSFARIVAFEPNPEAYQFLEANLRRLSCEVDPRPAAVSDFCGRGSLESHEGDRSDHAKFIVSRPGGTIAVERIDDLKIAADESLIIKVDVEGAELNVIKGAAESLRRAPAFAVGIEAHMGVMERTGIDPAECLRLLRSIRECRFIVTEQPEVKPDIDQPFFSQVRGRKHYNVLAISG